jgi:hypothetical protein
MICFHRQLKKGEPAAGLSCLAGGWEGSEEWRKISMNQCVLDGEMK